MDTYPEFSVLMSVYHREKLSNLKESINSVLEQSMLTNDFVIVCDGPLPEEMAEYLQELARVYPDIVRLIKLDENKGLSNALNIGIQKCKNELIARMDSDDICFKNRFEKQLNAFQEDKNLDIVGASIIEFSTNLSDAKYIRALPELNDSIYRFARKRCPFNHVSVMYKKQAVLFAGNYSSDYRQEDYYLWVRMMQNQVVCRNITEPLVYVRTGEGLHKRRGGISYLKSAVKLRKYMLETRFCNIFEFIYSVVAYAGSTMLPTRLRGWLYDNLLREDSHRVSNKSAL